VPKARLGDYLRELRIGNKIVVVQADARLAHGIVVGALDIAKQAGAERLAIATEPMARVPVRK